ncbi:MAG: SAM-dependent DNA methyltransferase [Schwartzia succinivorans]|nr:SAM-dependent DNA methyltransferase [Schwartzia succinivorans]
MAMSAMIKSLEDVMRKDAGLNGDAQYIEQITWMLFLKAFDAKEMEWELKDDYRPVVPKEYQWRTWAANPEGVTGDALIKLVNNLFEKLKNLDVSDGDPRKKVVRDVFQDINSYMKSGVYLRMLVNRINEKVDFIDARQKHTFNDLYEGMLKDLQSAGRAGEFYTPRPVTNFIVEKVNPKLGETILDPSCGTGGFLTSAIAHLGDVATTEELETLQASIMGWEKKPLPYLLAMTNLILHDIEVPRLSHKNSLARSVREYGKADQVDVIVTNPPFGGAEDDSIKKNVPAEFRTSETADLFLVLIMYLLKDKGRCGIVLPDGFMFGDGVKAAIKKRMLEEFGLHTIIRLPQVFKPYANVNTNLLFFQKGVKSEGVWFYRLDLPEGVKSFTKTKPMEDRHFDPVRAWWDKKEALAVDGKDKARYFTTEELVALNYDFDKCCPFPHEEDEILEPKELITRYQAEREALSGEIAGILKEIMEKLEQ